tara:strand:- start:526 stop:675 length:150 start_codon:yes stop_codon:yes gene_type:complete
MAAWVAGPSFPGTGQEEMTAYFTFAPCGTSIDDLALAAGSQWNIERCFQ